MFQLTFCHPPNSPFNLKFDSLSLTGQDLKLSLIKILPSGPEILDIGRMRLVCGGKVIQDQERLEIQGITDKSKIYISMKKSLSTSVNPVSTPKKPENDPLIAPLLKFLSENPELYQQMLMSNPQMQKLIEKNPELRHALSDPSTLKSMLNAASNPTAYNEMLRGHDRAMSNLENIPEGFSHLKKIYSTLQEPMYDAFTPVSRIKSEGPIEMKNNNSDSRKTTRDPIPNPWAPPPALIRPAPLSNNPVLGFKSHSLKRKHTSSSSIDMDEEGSAEEREMFGKLSGSMDAMRLLSPLGRLTKDEKGLASSSPSNFHERFRNELEALHQLGFEDDEGENIPALLSTGGHLSAAIDRILQRRGI